MCNRKDYCGAFWMPVKLRKFASKKFNASCRLHDIHYSQKKMTRKEADQVFLRNMLRQADGDREYIALAYLFYASVRVGGWYSWKYSE